MPKPKPHFAICLNGPLPMGEEWYLALCGEKLRNPRWVMKEYDLEVGSIHLWSTLNNCTKCIAKLRELDAPGQKVYVYLGIDGQLAQTPEEE